MPAATGDHLSPPLCHKLSTICSFSGSLRRLLELTAGVLPTGWGLAHGGAVPRVRPDWGLRRPSHYCCRTPAPSRVSRWRARHPAAALLVRCSRASPNRDFGADSCRCGCAPVAQECGQKSRQGSSTGRPRWAYAAPAPSLAGCCRWGMLCVQMQVWFSVSILGCREPGWEMVEHG